MKGRPTQRQFHERLEEVVQTLRDEILDGRYRVGSFLPSESVLAERFQISNKSLRIGLVALVKEGLIEKIPSVGNRVVTRRTRVTLTLMCPPSMLRDINLRKLLDEFHALYPWIRVDTIFGSAINECEKSMPADVMVLNQLQFQELVETKQSDKLEPLQETGSAYPFLTEAFTFKGLLYAQPIIFSPIVLCYNKDHFRERNVPEPDGSWTWEHLIRAATALSGGGDRYGLCFHLPSENRWPVFLLQSGEKFEWEAGMLKSIRDSRLLESVKLCKRIIHNRDIFPLYLSENSDDVQNLFAEGKVSMIMNNYMSMNELAHTGIHYDVSALPFIGEPRTLSVICGIAIHKHSLKKEAATVLADYFASVHGQEFIRRTTTSIPACKQVAEAPYEMPGINSPSRYGMFRDILFSLRKHSDLNLSVVAFGQLIKHLKAYWSDLIQEEQLCDRLQQSLSGNTPVFGLQEEEAAIQK